MFWKSPPTSWPASTVTLPPISSAETSRSRGRVGVDLGRDQPSQHHRALGVADEDNAAAVVVVSHVVLPGREHVAVGSSQAAGVSCHRRVDRTSVNCRYIGA